MGAGCGKLQVSLALLDCADGEGPRSHFLTKFVWKLVLALLGRVVGALGGIEMRQQKSTINR